MRRPALPVGGWIAAVYLLGSAVWSCSADEKDLFDESSRGGASGTAGTDTGEGGSAGSSTGGTTGGTTGGSPTGGSSGSSSGGDATGGTPTGGTTGYGGAAAESGSDSGGTATGGNAGMPGGAGAGAGAGDGGIPSVGGAGIGGAGIGGAGIGGMGGGGKAGSGGAPGDCRNDGNCESNEYCKKATCDATTGRCQARGPECRGANAEFEPVCGCDGITYWNTCAIEHEGFNVALHGECTGNGRPTCTRDDGGDSCPERSHVHCYRPVDVCGDTSPAMGVCWVLPAECPANEEQTHRYCGGTAGSARCMGLCEVIETENSFRRDAPPCAN